MIAEIVNLRLVRKRKQRKAREAKAAKNRAIHGTSKHDKDRLAAEADRAASNLAGHLRDREDHGD